MKNWQRVIKEWIVSTLGKEHFKSTHERAMRFAEEAAELCQSVGLDHSDFKRITDRSYSRPKGAPNQEIGGVFITFLALVENQDEVAFDLLTKEFNRINSPEGQAKVKAAAVQKRIEGIGI